MATSIKLNGVAANLEDAPINVAVALDDAGGFAGATDVLWELTQPPLGTAVLATPGHILLAPFTNKVTPTTSGNHLVRLVVTKADGSIETATRLIRVRMPYALDDEEQLPAPLEEREHDASTGWADEAARLLAETARLRSGNLDVVVQNDSGVTLFTGTIATLSDALAWPYKTGAGTGSPFAGQTSDHIALAKRATVANGRQNLALVTQVGNIARGARGRVMRRGLWVFDTSLFVDGDVLHLNHETGGLTTNLARPYPVGVVIRAALPTANPPGLIYFDPAAAEALTQGWRSIDLLDTQVAWADVDSAHLSWDAAATEPGLAAIIEFSVARPTPDRRDTGHIYISSDGAAAASAGVYKENAGGATNVRFRAAVVAGVTYLQYQSDPGAPSTPTLRYRIRQVFP